MGTLSQGPFRDTHQDSRQLPAVAHVELEAQARGQHPKKQQHEDNEDQNVGGREICGTKRGSCTLLHVETRPRCHPDTPNPWLCL